MTLTENHDIRGPVCGGNSIDGEHTITKGAAGPGGAGEQGRVTNSGEMHPQIGISHPPCPRAATTRIGRIWQFLPLSMKIDIVTMGSFVMRCTYVASVASHLVGNVFGRLNVGRVSDIE